MKQQTYNVIKPNTAIDDKQLFLTHEGVEAALNSAKDGVFVLDLEGHVLLMNEKAEENLNCLPQSLLNKPITPFLKKKYPMPNMRFKKAIYYFLQARSGIPQHFYWVEKENKRPLKAYHVLFNRITINDDIRMAVRIIDVTEAKMLEWFLLSLAEISNHGSLNAVIDDLTQLASTVLGMEHACVSLIRQNEEAHSVSYFYENTKQPSFSYALEHTPCAHVMRDKTLCFYNHDLARLFPKNRFIIEQNLHTYLGGPLKNAAQEVIGLLVLMSRNTLPLTPTVKTIFRLLRERINVEIERLLSQRKLQFLASIPQQDPNPVFRIQPCVGVVYSNRSGQAILNQWQDGATFIPQALASACEQARLTGTVQRLELDIGGASYLFTVIWIADFSQVNIYATDITELKLAQRKMHDLANYDPLTNIPNRQYFNTVIKKLLRYVKENETEIALLLIDIDSFKTINDTFGHHVGDKLLKKLAKRMEGCLRKEDFIARLGGDEFVVLIKLTDETDVERVAEKINASISANPFDLGGCRIDSACSIGITYFPGGGSNPSELLRNADTAMYEAKKRGKNQHIIYNAEKDHLISSRLVLLRKDLKQAVSNHQLYIDYQPQFNLKNNEIMGYEAFIRWRHPQKGLIPPSEFIPMAERTGNINALGQWSIEKVISDFAQTIQHTKPSTISINVALSQLSDQSFIDNLCEQLDKTHVSRNDVILDIAGQISEAHNQHLDSGLKTLHDEGIRLSLDDFGAKHTNLNRLLDVPFDFLKIDPHIMYTLNRNPRQRAFLQGIIELANQLKLSIIQKGVENEAQNELVKALGFEFAQGYYYCPPVPIDTLRLFIRQFYAC